MIHVESIGSSRACITAKSISILSESCGPQGGISRDKNAHRSAKRGHEGHEGYEGHEEKHLEMLFFMTFMFS
jgi:hypothetical protein